MISKKHFQLISEIVLIFLILILLVFLKLEWLIEVIMASVIYLIGLQGIKYFKEKYRYKRFLKKMDPLRKIKLNHIQKMRNFIKLKKEFIEYMTEHFKDK